MDLEAFLLPCREGIAERPPTRGFAVKKAATGRDVIRRVAMDQAVVGRIVWRSVAVEEGVLGEVLVSRGGALGLV
jgi:hypothetical protein